MLSFRRFTAEIKCDEFLLSAKINESIRHSGIAASVSTEHSKLGTKLEMEITIEAQRLTTSATVVKLPFFNPARKTATPL